MKFAHIVPVSNMEAIADQEYSMYLTHLVEKYMNYTKIAKANNGYKILDNSLIELGDAVNLDRIIRAAYMIGADEIVLPDKFLNGTETIRRVTNALDELTKLRELGNFKLMAVVHGSNVEDWCKCFDYLNNIKEIDVLGIPKVTSTLHPAGRYEFVKFAIDNTHKEIHLLGMWSSLIELFYYRGYGRFIRGVDSCLPALIASKNQAFSYIRSKGETLDLEKDGVLPYALDACIKEVNQFVQML